MKEKEAFEEYIRKAKETNGNVKMGELSREALEILTEINKKEGKKGLRKRLKRYVKGTR